MTDETCKVCGDVVGVMNRYNSPDGSAIHASCKSDYEAGKRVESFSDELERDITLTTAYSVIGRKMLREVDIVTAECVFGSNIFRDLFSGVRDIVGGRAKGQQNVLRDAKETCLRELKQAAIECGADAVIGVDLDYQELSGGGKSMLFLVASGTAVILDPSEETQRE
ncbi:MAG: YbjQ family protein [Halioglobus sp.]